MEAHIFVGVLGLLYILIFVGASLLRHEGLSKQFVFESLCVTGIAMLIIYAVVSIPPIIFILVLYAVTMRVRLLVDLANSSARRENYARAEKIYGYATRAGPDEMSRLIILINRAVMLLQEDHLDEAIQGFNEVIERTGKLKIGVKYIAAARYNLGLAYLRKGNRLQASEEFSSTISAWPGSEYAQRAQQALDRQQGIPS